MSDVATPPQARGVPPPASRPGASQIDTVISLLQAIAASQLRIEAASSRTEAALSRVEAMLAVPASLQGSSS